ncbi:ribosomal RNA processing 3'-5 [Scheffersomyces xylosifermentans]|uniref:ribosomal RNA processing 3'-5 n=1 Tax=Scheffersomyces xylosifermentans TaxID=1304137 RepID=UPI00315CD8AB
MPGSEENSQKDVLSRALPKVMQTVRAASALAAQDVNFYKSVDSQLSSEIDVSAKSLLDIANNLIRAASEESVSKSIRFGNDNIVSDADWKPIANVLDSLFEKVDSAFDQATRSNSTRVQEEKKDMEYLEDGNDANVKHSGKRISKPQLKFRVPVDNSESHSFKPKITSKPHSVKSFEESMELTNPEPKYEDSIEVIDPPYYPQPYEYEIDNQPYPESILEKSETIPPKDWSSTTAIWVDNIESLKAMVEDLSKSTEIAVDLEHHDYRSYYGIVCLMQISNREQDWIIDTLALRDDLEIVNTVFADPNIVKVFHGAFMDIIWLQRDLGLYVVSLFDTYHASKALGFPKFSLAYLLEAYANFKTSKKYQLADWRIRPLSPPMLAYARSDTHFLLSIFDQLKNKLIDAGEDKLQRVLYDSRQVAKRRFEYTSFRPLSNSNNSKVSCPVMANNPKEPYNSIMFQYNVPRHKKAVVEVLYNWRDVVGKKDDESVRFVMPNQLLVNLANLNSPVDVQKVLSCSHFVSEHVRLHAKELAELIDETLKRTADSDWELVDKWNDAPAGQESSAYDYEHVDASIASKTGSTFQHLFDSNETLLNNTDKSPLVAKRSILFANIYERNKEQVTIEYDPDQSVVIKHDFGKEYNDRLVEAWKGLSEIDDSYSIDVAVEAGSEEIIEEAEEPAGEANKEKTAILQEDHLDPNEIITLRKKQHKPQNFKPRQVPLKQSTEPALDFANSDKVMLEQQNRFKKNKKEKPKKRFDPFSRESEGPQPAKRSKRMTQGKSSTFKEKRRG